MAANEASENIEIERKYEVSRDAERPSAEAFAEAGLVASEPRRVRLAASYFDTEDGALARQRVAVRVRLGGKDEGWHLKEHRSDSVRELAWPVSQQMPQGLREELRARIGDAADRVAPVLSLRTVRTLVYLSGAGEEQGSAGAGSAGAADPAGAPASDGAADPADSLVEPVGSLVELADDRVQATDHAAGIERAWREWEAELLPDADPAVLDPVESVLIGAGATKSLSLAKSARARGHLTRLAVDAGASAPVLAALAVLDTADRLEGALSGAGAGRPEGERTEEERRVRELRGIAGALAAQR